VCPRDKAVAVVGARCRVYGEVEARVVNGRVETVRGEHPVQEYLAVKASVPGLSVLVAGETEEPVKAGADIVVYYSGGMVLYSPGWRRTLEDLLSRAGRVDAVVASPGYWYPVHEYFPEASPGNELARTLFEGSGEPRVYLVRDPVYDKVPVKNARVLVLAPKPVSDTVARILAGRGCRVYLLPEWFGHPDAYTVVEQFYESGARYLVLVGKPRRRVLWYLTSAMPTGAVKIMESEEIVLEV